MLISAPLLLATLALAQSGPAAASVATHQPASLLVFPIWSVRAGEISLYSITNTSPDVTNGSTLVQIVFVTSQCGRFERTELLTANDNFTAFVNLSGQGYFYAVAVSSQQLGGQPVAFEHLIGTSFVINAIRGGSLSVDPFYFSALGEEGSPTDVDGQGDLDLDGIEYSANPGELLFPSFLGQPLVGAGDQLVLVNMTDFSTTQVNFSIYNDNEEEFSAQHTFGCWTRTPLRTISSVFTSSFLRTTNHDPQEVVGFPLIEAGWFRVEGQVAFNENEALQAPPVLGVLLRNGLDWPVRPAGSGANAKGSLTHGL